MQTDSMNLDITVTYSSKLPDTVRLFYLLIPGYTFYFGTCADDITRCISSVFFCRITNYNNPEHAFPGYIVVHSCINTVPIRRLASPALSLSDEFAESKLHVEQILL